jgi:hypothetical protein
VHAWAIYAAHRQLTHLLQYTWQYTRSTPRMWRHVMADALSRQPLLSISAAFLQHLASAPDANLGDSACCLSPFPQLTRPTWWLAQ